MATQNLRDTLTLIIEQHANFLHSDTAKDIDGATLNLTGFTIASEIRKTLDSSIVTQVLTANITDEVNGIFAISLTAAQTTILDFGNDDFVYDVVVKDGSSNVTRILHGKMKLSLGITTI